jgi:hypothetical protein
MNERAMHAGPSVLAYLLSEGGRAIDRAAAAVAVGHPATVAECGMACDLSVALRSAALAAGADRTLAVLQALAAGDDHPERHGRGGVGSVELVLGRLPTPN